MSRAKGVADAIPTGRLICLAADSEVAVASRKMVERDTDIVVIVDRGNLLGIVTERDIVFKVIAAGRNPSRTRLGEIMTANPDTLDWDAKVGEALDLMLSHGYRHVPVVRNRRVIGVVSARDLFPEVRQDLINGAPAREHYTFGLGYARPAAAP